MVSLVVIFVSELEIMRSVLLLTVFLIVVSSLACTYKTDIPLEFPTPPPAPGSTPLAKLELKRDAELEAQIAKIAAEAKGKVGVAAVIIETGEAALLNADDRFPMQSVYKLPISMAVMDQVRLEKLELDEKVGVSKDEMVRAGMRSPLRDEDPNGGEFTIRELIRLALVESDGTASDGLMRVAGDAPEIQSYLTQIGIRDMKVVNTEKEMGRDWQTQYGNYSTPAEAVGLLRWLSARQIDSYIPGEVTDIEYDLHWLKSLSDADGRNLSGSRLLLSFMISSNPGAKRLKGLLPKGTVVAHKTGTSGTQNNVTAATNDIGIIQLPIGHLAIAVFVSDSPADEKTREAVIAKVAKAAWDRWSK